MRTCYARWKDNLRVKKEGGGVPFLPWILCFPADLQPKQMGRADDLLMEGLPAQQSASFYSPRRRRCHLLGIWVGTGPHVKSPTDLEDESDTALLCCIPLGHRPLRRFKVEDAAFCWEERCCWRWRRLDLGPDLCVWISSEWCAQDPVLLYRGGSEDGG